MFLLILLNIRACSTSDSELERMNAEYMMHGLNSIHLGKYVNYNSINFFSLCLKVVQKKECKTFAFSTEFRVFLISFYAYNFST